MRARSRRLKRTGRETRKREGQEEKRATRARRTRRERERRKDRTAAGVGHLDGVEVRDDLVELVEQEKAGRHALSPRDGVLFSLGCAHQLYA